MTTLPPTPDPSGGCHRADDELGPRVAIACRTFDFTLLFEDAAFVILPAALFLLLLPWRLRSLWRLPIKTEPNRLAIFKLTSLAVLLVCHVLFLAFRLQIPQLHTRLSIASGVLSTAAIAAASLQSFIEDRHSLSPSDTLVLYLSLTSVLSIPRLRSLWIIQSPTEIKALWTLVLILTCATLVVESVSKSRHLRPTYQGATKEQTVGFWNRSFFIWVLPFFQVGFSKPLQLSDIPAVDDDLQAESARTKLDVCWHAIKGRHRLIRATLAANKMPFMSAIVPRLCLAAFTICQPFLIEASVSYLATSPSDNEGTYGHALLGAFVLVNFGIAISRAVYWRYTFRLLAMIRCGLIAKVYRQTTTLNSAQLKDSAAITLMGTDVERIVESMRLVHELWASIPEVGVTVWLLARQVSGASVVPLLICIASVWTVSHVAVRYGPAQRQWVECVQKRITVITSMLLDMKSVKMLGFAPVLHDIVSRLREVELQTSERFRSLLVWQIVISNAPEHLAPFATFAAYAIISSFNNDESLFSAQAFASLSLITLVTGSLLTFCQALPACAQAAACFGRIEEYLNLENPIDQSTLPSLSLLSAEALQDSVPLTPLQSLRSSQSALVAFEGADISWPLDAPEPILRGLTMTIRPGFTSIIGPVASGKSTLIASLLGEATLNRGVQNPRLLSGAFCHQVPWIMNDTIQHNITGGLEFDQKWYNFSIWSCCLQEDLDAMPLGDRTLTGNNGASLSGGQRQRLALARAVYSRLPVVILDDVTSGLDPIITSIIMSRLFSEGGHFRKTGISVVLATHNRRLLPYMDAIVVLKDGRVVETGSYSEIRLRAPDLVEEPEDHQEIDSASPGEQSGCRQLPNEETSSLHEAVEEMIHESGESWRQNGSWAVYKYYYQSAGTHSVVLWAVATAFSAVAANYASLWLQRWAAANEREPGRQLGLYLGVYGLIFVISTTCMLAECWVFFVRIINDTALKLHHDLLKAVLKAPLSFFQKTDTGIITNRFSQDMDLIDMTLPSHAIQFTTGATSCVVQLAILCVLGKYLTATVPALAVVLYLVQRYYLRTSRQLRLIDIESKAPLYKHFIETVQGASTVRAFGWASSFQEQNATMLNHSQRPFYMLFCIQQWLTLVLDLIVGALTVILVAVATSLTNAFGPGGLGVALVLVISLSALLTQTIQAWTKMETSIGAVARVQQFVKSTPSEAMEDSSPPPNWPSRGAVRFENVTASYSPGTSPSLANLALEIASGEKIAVCGSSGSGKTSLIMAMLRMMDLDAGCISIDGVNISTLQGQHVRSRINVISQDPYFIPGTVKLNIDPRSHSTDRAIESAIRKVGLWEKISLTGGLGADLVAAEWSHGERQLLCLARALLTPSSILVLDEAMSSMDEQTEASMQQVLDTEFQQRTVVAVIHRFKYIHRFDKVAVLDHGRLVECDEPHALLGKDTALRRLYSSQFPSH